MRARTARRLAGTSTLGWLGIVAIAGIAVGVVVATAVIQRDSARRAALHEAQQRAVPPPGVERYVTSDRCQACHPDQYASWRNTYHSTMTQLPSEATIFGDFDDHVTKISTGEHRFYRKGDEFWLRLPRWRVKQLGTLLGTAPPSRDQRVALVTGSHHQQVYWISLDERLISAGVNWVREFQRYAPLQEVFLKPARKENHRGLQEWTSNCVRCHSTPAWRRFPARSASGRPAEVLHPMEPRTLSDQRPKTSGEIPSVRAELMPELGISCEACHGPAEEHAELFTSPLQRYAAYLGAERDPHIVNPTKVSTDESMQLCGTCHAPRPRFQVGDSELQRRENVRAPELAWPDGLIRSGGRGYLAVQRSPCFRGGKFTCLSCHSMHDAPPEDQLSSGMGGNEACLQCHQDFAAKLEAHTHHESDSSGSLCYNCHMPHTAWNLLKATRSHEVYNPDLRASTAAGRPNACNLCHLDRSLAWTVETLEKWYGHAPIGLSEEDREYSAAVLGALKGNAAQRALYAWSMGWPAAQEASGSRWLSPLLAILLDDPYPAVRAAATRSLRSLPDFGDFDVDPWRPNALGGSAKERALARWEELPPAEYRPGNKMLVDRGGDPSWPAIHALLTERDNTPVQIAE